MDECSGDEGGSTAWLGDGMCCTPFPLPCQCFFLYRQEYAMDQAHFFRDFEAAYLKLSELGLQA
jgi:hypothetical protein